MQFVELDYKIYPVSAIKRIEIADTQEFGIYISCDNNICQLRGQPAIDMVMRLCPQYFEGKRFKFIKRQWTFHNLLSHPILQILSWFKLHKLGFKIHDSSIPRPTGLKNDK